MLRSASRLRETGRDLPRETLRMIPILCALQDGPVRLGQLVRLMPSASKKVIAENLRQLEREGVIVRTDLSGPLLHVEYDYAEGFRLKMTSVLTSLASVGVLRRKKVD